MHEAFSEFGEIKNIYLNLERQTGFVKGYALVEYKTKREAQAAIDAMNGAELLTQKVVVDYAFKVGGSRVGCHNHHSTGIKVVTTENRRLQGQSDNSEVQL